MESFKLVVEKRTLLGKKAKRLKRTGYIPANIFGRNIDSVAVQVNQNEFLKVYKKAKKTHLLYLTLDKKELPVLIQNVQKESISNTPVHIDFRKMDLTQKVETSVPVMVIGELDVVKTGEADAILLSNTLMVKCLPTQIPEKIQIDISILSGIGAEVRVKDLPVEKTYEFAEEPEKAVLQISAAKKEEIVVPVAVEPVPGAEGEAAAAPVEGETAAPSTNPSVDKKVGEKKEKGK